MMQESVRRRVFPVVPDDPTEFRFKSAISTAFALNENKMSFLGVAFCDRILSE